MSERELRPRSFLLHQWLDAHAATVPGQQAIAFLEESLSYGQLCSESNRLAHCLLARGVQRGDRVGIYLDKCLQVPVALYGVMKAGAAYVPLDPSAPPERIADIVQDCGISHLLTSDRRYPRLADACGGIARQLTFLGPEDGAAGESWDGIHDNFPDSDPQVKVTADDLAYIIYTSGSTGTPKGIMHTHSSGLSFARWAAQEYGLTAHDRVSNHAPLHFDLSIFDYFATLVAGATTVIIPEEYTRLPPSYSQLIADMGISVLFTVPFALIQLALRGVLDQRDLSRLRLVIFGGEPMPPKYLAQLMEALPHTSFDNMYGPAEINGCSHYTLPAVPDAGFTIPIGPICAIADALVVDPDGAAVAAGATGELLVRTPTMMAGYWNRPDLNAAAFHRAQQGGLEQVYYRTGDLVRVNQDGVMVFVGRRDRQTKVRGYRVELDEIESTLAAHPAVEEAAIYTVTDEQGQAEIRGAFLTAGDSAELGETCLAYLKDRLPWYAVPTSLRALPQFPRTSTGKIDRRAICSEESQ